LEEFVQTCTRKPGIACDLGHALGASNIAQCYGDECRITVGQFKPRVLMGGHFLGRLKMPGGLPINARSIGRTPL
jgi:hypothetical protein